MLHNDIWLWIKCPAPHVDLLIRRPRTAGVFRRSGMSSLFVLNSEHIYTRTYANALRLHAENNPTEKDPLHKRRPHNAGKRPK